MHPDFKKDVNFKKTCMVERTVKTHPPSPVHTDVKKDVNPKKPQVVKRTVKTHPPSPMHYDVKKDVNPKSSVTNDSGMVVLEASAVSSGSGGGRVGGGGGGKKAGPLRSESMEFTDLRGKTLAFSTRKELQRQMLNNEPASFL
ncbi:Uncharacterized protein Fot_40383 [Forsythia ovata]|uniref:Uncharacterized protein n=1 Tax=Forsythia ovata TaxID=205694 RepID=A0ABD1S796_9LAMI